MTVRVIAPSFADHSEIDDLGDMTLPEGACLRDIYRKLRIPPLLSGLLVCSVNYARVGLDHRLSEGDTVSFFSILSGG
jgi:molybdopterin converting factor small subunit